MRALMILTISVFCASFVHAQKIVSTTPEDKNVVLEEYTGMYCQYCPDGHKRADDLYNDNPGSVVVINIHEGYYATPQSSAHPDFRTDFGDALVSEADVGGYPAGSVNRRYFPSYAQEAGTAMSRTYWTSAAGQIFNEPSPVNVAATAEIDTNALDSDSTLLTVYVEVYYTDTVSDATNKLNVALLEHDILGYQTAGGTYYPEMVVGTDTVNGGDIYKHNKMLRHFLTGQWGEDITNTDKDGLSSFTYTYHIPPDYGDYDNPPYYTDGKVKLDALEVAAYVAEEAQSGEIYTGTKVPVTHVQETAVREPVVEPEVKIYPNPVRDKAYIEFRLEQQGEASAKVYNMTGAQVMRENFGMLPAGRSTVHMDSSTLPAGMYMVQVNTGQNSVVRKISVLD